MAVETERERRNGLDSELVRAVESCLSPQIKRTSGDEVYFNSVYPDHPDDTDAHMSYNRATHTFFDHKLGRGGGLYELAGLLGVTITRSGNDATQRVFYSYANGLRKVRQPVIKDGKPDKKMWWQHLDASGRWKDGRDKRDPGMYRQDEAFAGHPSEWIHVFNGEKAADRAVLEGIARATCFPDGEGTGDKIKPAYLPLFKGRKVIWHQDNDAAGVDFAQEMKRKLPQIAGTVRVMEWGEYGLPEHGDAYDAFEAGIRPEDILGAVEKLADVPKPIVPLLRAVTWADAQGQIGQVEWEWRDHLPKGFLTLLTAYAGVGKSALALRICGTIINRWPWPDGTPYEGEPMAVLWCEAEFAQAINIARAAAWGVPLEKFYTPFKDPMQTVELDNEEHRAAILEMALRPDVGLVAVDSYSGATGVDENKPEAKDLGFRLAQLARDCGKPVLCTHHLGKRGVYEPGRPVTLDMVRGHSSIVQPSRVVWALDVPDANFPNRKRLSVIKNNLGQLAAPIGLTIGDSGIQFGDAPEPPRQESQIGRACDLLRALLASGPIKQADLEGEARGAGISWDTMKRAKDKLGIVARRDGKARCWTWALSVDPEPMP